MIEAVFTEVKSRMQKSIDALKNELSKVRTGRVHAGLLDHVQVSYYGNMTPLNQVASVNVEGARTLTVTPWEKNLVGDIEKAILKADLGLNPSTAGTVIRIPMPPLTEERRRELTKVVREEAERARVSIRNIRRDANNEFKVLLKDKKINEDDERRAEARMQKLTDEFISTVEETTTAKEKDLMAI
jgi:ribosome recycling factor